MKTEFYHTYKYPYASKLNPRLYEIINERARCSIPSCAKSIKKPLPHNRTEWYLHKEKIKEVDTLVTWIQNLLPEASFRHVKGKFDKIDPKTVHDNLGFNPYAFKIHQCWGIVYKKGQGVMEHTHFPCPLAFVYYVKAPEGCAPTIFKGKRIRPKEGELLLFEGHHLHGVPPSKVEGRCVVSGLILYRPDD